ncbi:MAG TPA: hypothetical protein VEP47_08860 [Reyranella sp.]|nr:hypothetical protein [Reyranella sp.]
MPSWRMRCAVVWASFLNRSWPSRPAPEPTPASVSECARSGWSRPKCAVARARAYVRQAIETAPGFGRGHGPLNHAVTVNS